jgi:glutamate N-acetyltransferase/amino-acid N-acetyltransferase
MTKGPGLLRTPLPEGFAASGVNCGVRRYRPDLGLLFSDRPAVAAGVFTQSTSRAAPVVYSQMLLPSRSIRAIITNSGQANAATGPEGVSRNHSLVEATAEACQIDASQVLVASTGVIGAQLATDKILPALPELFARRQEDAAESFALAILTTDLVPKTVSTTVALSGGLVRITGIAKGSGMIHPNMATMLGYILTDAQMTPQQADLWLRECTDQSFNMISVDGDTSTNDCVFLMANGASGVQISSEDDQVNFRAALAELSRILAQSIATDGEGATKLIEVNVTGSPSLELARRCARSITVSPLIKTAIHGEDPNWGRVLARLGAEQVPSDSLSRTGFSFQGVSVFSGGQPVAFDREALRGKLKVNKVSLDIDLGSGRFSATAWGCDLSRKYVDINTEYS